VGTAAQRRCPSAAATLCLRDRLVVGDPEGVAALKAMAAEHRDYLKFLLNEAKSATGHAASFRAADGTRWEVVLRPESGDLEVRKPVTVPPPAS
jgi:hypothetical protein